MTPTLNPPMISLNQNVQPNSGISRNDQKLIRAAVAQIATALKGKPADAADFFYDLTRTDPELRNQQLDALVIRSRQALAEAKKQGVGIQAATVARVEIMFATLCAISIHGYEVGAVDSLPQALVSITEEASDVVCAASRVQREPSPSNLESLRKESLELIGITEDVADMASMHLAGAR